jgi:hypothetical protein
LTWAAFVIAAIAGLLLFINRATEYLGNTAFRIKGVADCPLPGPTWQFSSSSRFAMCKKMEQMK